MEAEGYMTLNGAERVLVLGSAPYTGWLFSLKLFGGLPTIYVRLTQAGSDVLLKKGHITWS